MEFPLERQRVPDRNRDQGGRSFYFFDFDDNVMALGTQIFVFERDTGAERALSTAEFAAASPYLGKPGGPWEQYAVCLDDKTGSFRRFRDHDEPGAQQPFMQDIDAALAQSTHTWQGPSWELFYHAVHNQRPLSVITARGHQPQTIAAGIARLKQAGHLSAWPNYLSLLPVSHPGVRTRLGDPNGQTSIPELKRLAIVYCVEAAMARYGESPHHRFGMSDDAPDNLKLVGAAMQSLKARYPQNAFFVIDSSQWPLVKNEILIDSIRRTEVETITQLELFD